MEFDFLAETLYQFRDIDFRSCSNLSQALEKMFKDDKVYSLFEAFDIGKSFEGWINSADPGFDHQGLSPFYGFYMFTEREFDEFKLNATINFRRSSTGESFEVINVHSRPIDVYSMISYLGSTKNMFHQYNSNSTWYMVAMRFDKNRLLKLINSKDSTMFHRNEDQSLGFYKPYSFNKREIQSFEVFKVNFDLPQFYTDFFDNKLGSLSSWGRSFNPTFFKIPRGVMVDTIDNTPFQAIQCLGVFGLFRVFDILGADNEQRVFRRSDSFFKDFKTEFFTHFDINPDSGFKCNGIEMLRNSTDNEAKFQKFKSLIAPFNKDESDMDTD